MMEPWRDVFGSDKLSTVRKLHMNNNNDVINDYHDYDLHTHTRARQRPDISVGNGVVKAYLC